MRKHYLRSLLLNCEFHQLLEQTRCVVDLEQRNRQPYFVFGYRIHALFELHRIEELKEIRAFLSAEETPCFNIEYHESRFLINDKQYEKALLGFRKVAKGSSDPELLVSAEIGIAGALYLLGETTSAIEVCEQLLRQDIPDVYKLCALHTLGSCRIKEPESIANLLESFSLSVSNNWKYWTCKSLYCLAKAYESQGKRESLLTTIDMLNSIVRKIEWPYMLHLIHERFVEQPISTHKKLHLDDSTKEVTVDNQVLSFANRPVLFEFLTSTDFQNESEVTMVVLSHRQVF